MLYSLTIRAAVPGSLHHGAFLHDPRKHRVRNDVRVREDATELEKAARHVVVAGDEPQRLVSACPHPSGGFDGVAGGIAGSVARVDAALDGLRRSAGNPQKFRYRNTRMDAGNEGSLRLVRGKKLQTSGDALTAAGQDDNRVGGRDGIGHFVRDVTSKANESDRPQGGDSDSQAPEKNEDVHPSSASGRTGRRAAVARGLPPRVRIR